MANIIVYSSEHAHIWMVWIGMGMWVRLGACVDVVGEIMHVVDIVLSIDDGIVLMTMMILYR